MSREIKFRAWDKWRKEMIEPHEGDFIRWHAPSNWKECYEVMQYTGLKDRNGKEIYEGDIIRIDHPFKGRSYVGEIMYDKYSFTAKDFYFTHHDNPGDPFESLSYMDVIGNIYEHPNLLKE